MERSQDFEGRTLEEALGRAAETLGLQMEDLTYEVIEDGRKGFLGLGARPTKIRVTGFSGAMAAAMRFAFQRGGPLGPSRGNDEAAYRVPATRLSVMLREPRLVVFMIVWFGVNLLFGLGIVSLPGESDMPIAWEAHIGGFLAGLVTFVLFDPAQVDAPSEESIEA